jgi:hypothetical protein
VVRVYVINRGERKEERKEERDEERCERREERLNNDERRFRHKKRDAVIDREGV